MPRLYFIESALTSALNTLVLAVDTTGAAPILRLQAVQDIDLHHFEVHPKGLIRNKGFPDGQGFIHRPAGGSGSFTLQAGNPGNPDARQVWEFDHLGEYTFVLPPPSLGGGDPSLLTATAAGAEVTLGGLVFPIPAGQLWKFIEV